VETPGVFLKYIRIEMEAPGTFFGELLFEREWIFEIFNGGAWYF
jgi:hypothetical protein